MSWGLFWVSVAFGMLFVVGCAYVLRAAVRLRRAQSEVNRMMADLTEMAKDPAAVMSFMMAMDLMDAGVVIDCGPRIQNEVLLRPPTRPAGALFQTPPGDRKSQE